MKIKKSMRLLCVVGTRPNFVKIAAIYKEMRKRENIEPILVHTGQHFDKNMSENFFKEFELPIPDLNLNVAGGTHTYQTGQIMLRFEPILSEFSPDVVIVVGDVNSTLAASLVVAKCNIPLAHVEAGLRSGDRFMPEELNRILVDQLADFLFVTEQSGIDNLKKEGISEDKIFFVGNVMIDTLITHLKKARKSDILNRFNLSKNNYALITLHRPSNSDNREVLTDILYAIKEISSDLKILFPIHPRTKKRIEDFGLIKLIENQPGFLIIEPLGYFDFLKAMENARVVITDSGGIQEETTILGVPCLTLRNNTERPVTIQYGTNKLVGIEGKNLIRSFRTLYKNRNSSNERPPLWDGKAASRIIDILELKIRGKCNKKSFKES